ncbi:hypothetical protein H0X32_03425 [Patescibacteria group bacterium]|nr:hypothetical protein [Patescibacteria group bacterium]
MLNGFKKPLVLAWHAPEIIARHERMGYRLFSGFGIYVRFSRIKQSGKPKSKSRKRNDIAGEEIFRIDLSSPDDFPPSKKGPRTVRVIRDWDADLRLREILYAAIMLKCVPLDISHRLQVRVGSSIRDMHIVRRKLSVLN